MERVEERGPVYASDPLRPVLSGAGMYLPHNSLGSSESSSEEESAEEDMTVDTSTTFQLSREKVVRRESAYSPSSSGTSGSDSGSDSSSSSASESDNSRQNHVPKPSNNRRILDEDSDDDSLPSTGRVTFDLVPPRRSAMRNVNYSKFYESEGDSGSDTHLGGRRRERSDSEFEASLSEPSEPLSDSISEVESSEEEYLPTRRKGGGRKKRRGGQKVRKMDA